MEMLGTKAWGDYENTFALLFAIGNSEEGPKNIPADIHPLLTNFLSKCCFQRDPANRPSARLLLFHPYMLLSEKDVTKGDKGQTLS